MSSLFRKSWEGLLAPILRRPSFVQLGALCWRRGDTGIEVLLVTSSRGRWILPKGWPIDGLTGSETALQEAWEEAGVKRAKAAAKALGGFDCIKRLESGTEVPCRTAVYALEVKKTSKSYPENDHRERKWVSQEKAIDMVSETGLKAILAAFKP